MKWHSNKDERDRANIKKKLFVQNWGKNTQKAMCSHYPLFELYGNEHTLQTFTHFSLIQHNFGIVSMSAVSPNVLIYDQV